MAGLVSSLPLSSSGVIEEQAEERIQKNIENHIPEELYFFSYEYC